MTTKKELIYAVANRTGFKKSSVERQGKRQAAPRN